MSLKFRLGDSFHRGLALLVGPRGSPLEDEDCCLPLISIVTPVLNAESTIVETVDSVLSQDYPRLEYTIVDGGSKDRTLELLAPYRSRIDRIISEPDAGVYDALQKGFKAASGEIFAYLNADDVYLPGAFKRVGKYFKDNPRSWAIYFEDVVENKGWWFANRAQPHVSFRRLRKPSPDKVWKGHILYQDGVFWRREAYQSVGGFNVELKLAGDWDLWMRILNKYSMERLRGHVSCFRIRPGQLSSDMIGYNSELEFAKKSFNSGHGLWQLLGYCFREMRVILLNAIDWCVGRARFYPIPFHQLERSKVVHPLRVSSTPVCPITGEGADHFLFSSQDTRFGDEDVSHWYACEESEIAICYPPLNRKRLDALYEKNYSSSSTHFSSKSNTEGLFAKFRGGSFLTRLSLYFSLPIAVSDRIIGEGNGSVWKDSTADEFLEIIGDATSLEDPTIDFLDVGCFEGILLEELRRRTQWSLIGSDPNGAAVSVARGKGFKIWEGHAEDLSDLLPVSEKFDFVFLGQTIEHLNEPLGSLRHLSGLLKKGGRIIISTPNLNSKQLELFGPTWAHWHPPYHRHIFSLNALRQLGEEVDLEMEKWRSYSHPYWSAMSLQLNQRGVDGFVPHGIPVPEEIIPKAQSLAGWAKLLWNWRGKGDYLYVMYRKR